MGAGKSQSRGRIRPMPARTYVRETQGRGAGRGPEAASGAGVVSRAYRARARRGEVVSERVGPRRRARGPATEGAHAAA